MSSVTIGPDNIAMTANLHSRFRVRTMLLVAGSIVLTWLVISKSLAAYLADAAPRWALLINSDQPDALLNIADRSLNSGANSLLLNSDRPDDAAASGPGRSGNQAEKALSLQEAKPDSEKLSDAFSIVGDGRSVDLPALQADVSAAVLNQPLSARGLRLLGQIADTGGDKADAFNLMSAAARLSLHETLAVYWLMRKSAENKDYAAAVQYADAMMRTNPQLAQYVVPVLAGFAGDKNAFAAVQSALQSNPPWRDQFFLLLPTSVTDARTPLKFLMALRHDPIPLKTADIKNYINLLVTYRYFSLAYYTWLQFLTPDELLHAGLLFNGGFDVEPSGLPFDWVIKQGPGVTIDIVSPSDKGGGHALLIDFKFGRVEYHSVSELVMLPPGSYQFSGEFKGELVGPRGMKWRIACASAKSDATMTLAESPMINGVTKNWTPIGFDFTIPDKDCTAQYVRLDLDARMASEQLVSGSVLFDNLRIVRPVKSAASGE